MYLSCLLIDVGENPDRPRPGRLWLRNLYHVYQRLCMAFPSATRRSDDPHFLRPFAPEDFGAEHVHVPRGSDAGFLFRVDPQPGGGIVVLVQSAVRPDWDHAFRNAGHLLAACPQVKPLDPCFAEGQRLRFRLVANPTRKIDTRSGPDGCRRNGKRVPVPADQLHAWLAHRAESAGFLVDQCSTTVQQGYVYVNETRDDSGHRLRSVRYDGILRVTDPGLFLSTLAKGFGSAKGFGFGLLSVARI
jgi:CRISPR system Cascade subunit CasE